MVTAIATVTVTSAAALLATAAWAVEEVCRKHSRRSPARETPAAEAAEGLPVTAPAGMALLSWEEAGEDAAAQLAAPRPQ